MTEGDLLDKYLGIVAGSCGATKTGGRLLRGQFHDVVLLGEVAYRFPRDGESRRLLPARIALLRVLQACGTPVGIPGLLSDVAVGQPLGRCHVALQRIAGEPTGTDHFVDAPAESGALTDLAVLLDRLLELGTHPAIHQAAPKADRHQWQRFADEVSSVLFPLMSRAGRTRAEGELNRVQAVDPTGRALVHGDLGGTNLLWTVAGSQPRLAGVVDWDEAHIGNQAEDLASIAATFGWPFATRLDANRHDGEAHTVAAAQAIAATFALQQALPAALSGDTPALDDGLLAYRDS